jgi:hypothetical protein
LTSNILTLNTLHTQSNSFNVMQWSKRVDYLLFNALSSFSSSGMRTVETSEGRSQDYIKNKKTQNKKNVSSCILSCPWPWRRLPKLPSDAVAVVFLFVWCFGILHRLRRLCVLQLKKLLLYLISPVKLNFFLQGCRSNPTNCLNKKINPPSSSLHSWWAVVQMTSDWQKLRGYQRRTYVHTHHSGCDTSAWNQSLFQSQKFSDK